MALMLTRRPGESILIARDICVTYVEYGSAHEMRLAVTAPREVAVDRLELALRLDPALGQLWNADGTRRLAYRDGDGAGWADGTGGAGGAGGTDGWALPR